MNHSLPLSDYLTRILTASVYDVAVENAFGFGTQFVRPSEQSGFAQARRFATGVFVQNPRRVQQNGETS